MASKYVWTKSVLQEMQRISKFMSFLLIFTFQSLSLRTYTYFWILLIIIDSSRWEYHSRPVENIIAWGYLTEGQGLMTRKKIYPICWESRSAQQNSLTCIYRTVFANIVCTCFFSFIWILSNSVCINNSNKHGYSSFFVKSMKNE